MQEFAQDTPVVLVVTHRQTTMESAHTLLRVTMGRGRGLPDHLSGIETGGV